MTKFLFLFLGLILLTLTEGNAELYNCFNPYDTEKKPLPEQIKGLEGLSPKAAAKACHDVNPQDCPNPETEKAEKLWCTASAAPPKKKPFGFF